LRVGGSGFLGQSDAGEEDIWSVPDGISFGHGTFLAPNQKLRI